MRAADHRNWVSFFLNGLITNATSQWSPQKSLGAISQVLTYGLLLFHVWLAKRKSNNLLGNYDGRFQYVVDKLLRWKKKWRVRFINDLTKIFNHSVSVYSTLFESFKAYWIELPNDNKQYCSRYPKILTATFQDPMSSNLR